ncbi:MAG: DUF4124 domain-containing protein [Burkholderiales bacterium]|nr:DUF4124 domain-containing protein [Burkholderiales bacterium]MCA3230377.1 DUF4124 domain-containing protein [Burkholderiales bacterium]
MRFVLLSSLTGALLGIAAPAAAQTYRWLDPEGRVHYGDAPPAQARELRALNAERSTLSVVPGLSKEDLEAARRRSEQARIEQLEREVAALRDRPAPAPTTIVLPPLATSAPVLLYPVRPPRPKPPAPPVQPPPQAQQPPLPATTSVSVSVTRR